MYVETVDDLNKKYAHTYVFHNNSLIYVDGFAIGADGLVVMCTPGEGLSSVHLPVGNLEPIILNEMFVNNAKFNSKASEPSVPLAHFRRSPRRQWKRGLSKDNCLVSCPYARLYSVFGSSLRGWDGRLSFKLINHLLKPEYPTWSQALKLLPSYQAIALSPLFAIMLSSISRDQFLITNTFGFVAEATEDCIKVRHEAALQEIRDWVLRNNIQVSVEMDSAHP